MKNSGKRALKSKRTDGANRNLAVNLSGS